MTHMQIPMPRELELFIRRQISDGTYPSASDDVCALIREARLKAARRILNESRQNPRILRRAVPGGPEP